MQHFIIDGYNVIHAVPSLKKTLLHDAESARELLIYSVGQLTHQKKFRASIIFDGIAPDHSTKQSAHAPVHVVFSFPHSADTAMKRMIERSKNSNLLTIVTSDREIMRFAKVHSCITHTSHYFANLLSDANDTVTEKSEVSLSTEQINEWLKIFGEK